MPCGRIGTARLSFLCHCESAPSLVLGHALPFVELEDSHRRRILGDVDAPTREAAEAACGAKVQCQRRRPQTAGGSGACRRIARQDDGSDMPGGPLPGRKGGVIHRSSSIRSPPGL
jgi:hypothetical protein